MIIIIILIITIIYYYFIIIIIITYMHALYSYYMNSSCNKVLDIHTNIGMYRYM